MKTKALIICMTITMNCMAQNTGKTEFKGLEFTIPNGWSGSSDKDVYFLQSNNSTHYIIIQPTPFIDVNHIMQELNAEIALGEGMGNLQRSSDFESITQNCIGTHYLGGNSFNAFNMYGIGVTNNAGRGAMLLAGDQSGQHMESYEIVCKEVASGLTFVEFANKMVSKKAGNTWEKNFSDVRLTYIDSYYSSGYGDMSGGYRQKVIIDLCGQGYFTYSDNFEMGGGGDNSAFLGSDGQNGHGTWEINTSGATPELVLNFRNGTSKHFNVEVNNEGATFLNGDRFYRTTEYDEDENYRPACY